jgi:predicted regulator of Ras-like GTPase activity (Roadblock/LC7/MglB family)
MERNFVSVAGPAGRDLNWLVTNFVERVPEAAHAMIVSADGLALGISDGLPRAGAEQLAAVVSGLASLTDGAARIFEAGPVVQTAVEMQAGVVVLMAVSNGASLAVLAGSNCDLELIAYEMALLAERAGRMITPAVRA